ncbi:hypothetical protein SFC55_14045 [Niallia taxi]|uniref:hypothetical protein n=1 Tax=Niallia taxi TaxID=2499688 RepID=UPI003981F55F
MAYIIENISILKKQSLKKTSMLIQDNRIDALKERFAKERSIRMDGNSYIMTPTPIVYDNDVTKLKPSEQKEHVQAMIKRGCTMVLTACDVRKERELSAELKKTKNMLLNCAVDYVICIKIPLKILTASLIRSCKKEKIPAVIVEINQAEDLYKVPWGWIKEAAFPFNCPLIPQFLMEDEEERTKAQTAWSIIMRDANISSLKKELMENDIISYEALIKIGIYPFKGNIYQGGEVTYNLYEKSRSIINIDEKELYHYHYNKILVTYHKGVCVRAGEKVFYHPGFGDQMEIKVPSFFNTGGV